MPHFRFKKYFLLFFLVCTFAFAKFHNNLLDPTISSNSRDISTLNINENNKKNTESLFSLKFPDDKEKLSNFKIFCPIAIDTTGISIIDVSCSGGNDGAISGYTVSGVSGILNYEWKRGAVVVSLSQNLTNVPAGVYTLTVTDTNGPCSDSINLEIISPASLITIIANSPPTQELNCIGDSNASLGINITVTPPAVPLIEWFKNGSKIDEGVTFVENLGVGSYEVRVTDTNSPLACAVTSTFEITEPEAFSYVKTTFTDPDCFNSPLGGTVTYEATGGTTPYYYSVDGGAIVPVPGTTLYITNLSDGAHSIEITDSNNCNILAPDNHLTTFPTEITIDPTIVTIDNISCFAANDGMIIPNNAVSGGFPPYTYTWSGPSGIFYTENISGLQPGTYELNVVDSKGCIAGPFNFDVLDILELKITSVNVLKDVLDCAGDTDSNITIEVEKDPTSTLQIDWFLNGSLYKSGVDFNFTNAGAGTYQVVVTDTNSRSSCSVSEIVVITEPTLFGAFIGASSIPDCYNDPGGGNLTINLGGGTPPYFYSIDGGAPITSNITPIEITDLSDGLHIITVTDNLGCNPVTFSHTVNLPKEIVVNPTLVDITGISCYGAGDGSINLNNAVSGGTPNYTYTWTGPAGGTHFGASVNNLIPGSYSLVIQDLLGCTIPPVIFEVPDILPLEIIGEIVTNENLECNGDMNGDIAIQIRKDPKANIEIEWFKNGTSYDNSNIDNIANLGAGTYEVVVTDVNAASSCIATQIFKITEPLLFEAEISSFQDPDCFDDIQGGSITLKFSGGTLPYSYKLDGAAAVVVNNNSPVVLTGLSDGQHSVLATDSNGCNPITLPHLVTLPNEIQVQYDPQTDIIPVECGGGGEISVFASGGTGTNYFYVWNGPSFGRSGFDLATVTDLENGGIYTLTVFDENNCPSETLNFTVPSFPNAFTVNSVVNQMTCPTGEGNGSIQLTLGNDLVAPYFVKWEKWELTDPDDTGCLQDCYSWQLIPDGSDSLVIRDLDAGEYRVTITDSGSPNCNEVQRSFTILENSLEILSDELQFPTCDNFDAFYKFKLNNVGQVNFFLNGSPIAVGGPILTLNNATHEYTLQLAAVNVPTSFLLKMTEDIPDGNGGIIQGCEVLKGLAINPYQVVTYLGTTGVILDMCQGDASFTIDELAVTGGTPFIDSDGDPFYSYEWFGPDNFRATGATISPQVGEYTLLIRDSETCESEPYTIIFSPDNDPIEVISEIGNVSCDGEDDGYVAIEISGGKEPYSILWELEIPSSDSGSSDPTYTLVGTNLLRLNNLEEGRYRLTVTSDIPTCTTDNPAYQFQTIYSVNSSHTIAVLDGPFLDNDLCVGNPGTLTINVSDTRSGPISFYYNGDVVGAEKIGDNTYLIFIANPVEISILDVLNELGCGEAIDFDIGLGDPSFITSSNGYDFNGIVNLNEEISFTNTSTDPYTLLEWDFDDRSDLITEDSPTHVYQASGTYDVTLRIYNELGCYKEFVEQIRVGEEYYVIFPDVFTPNSDGVNDFFLGEMTGINSFEFEIYDIWNNLLFARATNASSAGNWGWDGKLSDGSDFNGKIFKYVFKGIDTSGKEVIISRQALLLR